MSSAPIASTLDSKLPLRPFLEVQTIKTYDRGWAINGIHQPNIKPLDLYLDLLDAPLAQLHCSSCSRVIENGEIFGDGSFRGNGRHCIDCVTFPDQPIEAWQITYRMGRKTAKHPDGKNTITIVNLPHVCAEYISLVHEAHGELELIRRHPPINTKAQAGEYLTALTTRRALIYSALTGVIDQVQFTALNEELAELERELQEMEL